jgi:CheY-like chemotaxis protein
MHISPPTELLRPLVLVDNDPDDIALIRLLLRKAGVPNPLHVYQCGEEMMAAFSTLLKKSISLLPLICFLDLGLPDKSGLELLQWIRSHAKFDAVSVVMLTGSEHPQDVRSAASDGAQCYLGKYPHPTVLRRVIDEATVPMPQPPAQRWFGLQANLLLRWIPTTNPPLNSPA